MTRKMLSVFSLLLLFSMTGTAVSAEVYKWVDEQGQVHYGDKAPEQGASSLQVDPGPAADTPPPDEAERREKRHRLLRAYEQERQIKQQREQEQTAREAERKKRCAWARDRLRRYTHAGALYDLDEEGNRRLLDDSQRQQAEANARQDVKKWCQ